MEDKKESIITAIRCNNRDTVLIKHISSISYSYPPSGDCTIHFHMDNGDVISRRCHGLEDMHAISMMVYRGIVHV